MRKLLLLAVLIVLLAACGPGQLPGHTPTPDPCSLEQVDEYLEAIRDVARRFDDTVEVANATPRINLSSSISDLQEIRRDAEDLEVPACAEDARAALIVYMDAEIDAFLAFMRQESDSVVSAKMRTAQNHYLNYADELEAMLEGVEE